MSPWKVIDTMRSIDATHVALQDIRTHKCLQPRNDRLVPYKDAGREKQASDEHVQTLCLVLDASLDTELEPIWLADIPNTPGRQVPAGLYVVDGHHRLAAYKRANRKTIPARVHPLDFTSAVIATKPINCSGCKLRMHREQRLDAAWQYLAVAMERGLRPLLPSGESLRTIAAKFGIGHQTVSRMMVEIRRISLEEYPQATRDPGTDWPLWKYVRTPKSIWQTPIEVLPDGARTARNAESLARAIADIMEKSSPEERALALQLLASQAESGTCEPEAVNFLADAARPYGTYVEYVLSHWDSKRAAQAK